MSNTLIDDIVGVRDLLGSPLDQSPNVNEILTELEAEYLSASNSLNATGDGWQVAEYNLTTVPNQYRYDITDVIPNFEKALLVTTVPDNTRAEPEYVLEFIEIERIPQAWAWISASKGQYMYSSNDSQLVAFYRSIDSGGERKWLELRPVPAQVETYRILYQQGNWMDVADKKLTVYTPHQTQKFYIRAKTARNILMKGRVKWSYDDKSNAEKTQMMLAGLAVRIPELASNFENYKRSLDNPDITYITPWADDVIDILG